MKNNLYLFILLLIGTLFTSCKKSDIAYENDFDKSYKSWVSFKSSSNNSYRYTILTSSWTGYSTGTTISVRNGKVVQRSYTAKGSLNNSTTNIFTTVEEWIEDENSLNTHQNGYPTLILDEIYQKARSEWLLKRKDVTTYLETKNNGMISSCGYVEKGCQDDCFNGVYISLIEKI